MAQINKKTRTVYNLELDEEEMKVLANLLYRTQMGKTGPAAAASRIYREVDKYVHVNEFDPAGKVNYIGMYTVGRDSLYWESNN